MKPAAPFFGVGSAPIMECNMFLFELQKKRLETGVWNHSYHSRVLLVWSIFSRGTLQPKPSLGSGLPRERRYVELPICLPLGDVAEARDSTGKIYGVKRFRAPRLCGFDVNP